MLSDSEINEYITTSIRLGSYHELIQGSGGNFSFKNDKYIIIKSSGRVLAETNKDYGYVICSLDKLNKCIEDSSINLKTSVVGGELNGIPSMEVFFHLLPYKWIIHVHPTSLLVYLCQEKWNTLISSYKYSYMKYKTPGKELGISILESFKGEQVIFLQNHGVIVCSNNIQEINLILDDLYKLNIKSTNSPINTDEFTDAYSFNKYLDTITSQKLIIKPCRNINKISSPFYLITPDIALFLKKEPLIQKDYSKSKIELLDIYYKKFHMIPSVIQFGNMTYVCGRSYHQCITIDEILVSYLEILSKCNPIDLQLFDETNLVSIKSSESEIHRLNIA